MQRAEGAFLRQHGADHRPRADRSGDRRPAEDAEASLPQRLDAHAAGLAVRRLAVDAAPGVSARFAGRREDPRLLKGEGRYTADWNFPGQLYGAFLRADRAHAPITRIDTAAARAMPGVAAIYTGEDLKHFKTAPPQGKHPAPGGVHLKVPE